MGRKYNIAVRARPVNHPLGQFVATHCYLALLCPEGVVDTLSFDPSNSIGWSDGDPENSSRGELVVERNCDEQAWQSLKDAFKRGANRGVYVLGHHNCCHAVMDALVATNLTNAKAGIHFARDANMTWHDANGNLGTSEYIKKNV